MTTRLRVVTWNIRAAIGPGPFPDRWWRHIDADRLRAIGVFLSSLDADLVALQEVALVARDGEIVDNAGDLARQLGLEARYAAARSFEVLEDGGLRGVGAFGNAILTRLPIRDAGCVALPRAPHDAMIEPPEARHALSGEPHPAAGVRYADAPADIREPRCLLAVDLEGIRVGSTHLSHIGSGERRLQADAVVAALAAPAVLLGDLNAGIEAPELATFATWADAFAEPPGDPARISTDDGWRIDHVLGRGVEVRGARVLRDAGHLSDHYPVAATVMLR
ncbi:MAG TPA: endonuclease/exonuclease/phosphatase family protein [Candidatus Angelobacter sp.]|nr:endonuclease/exonuclease/phosphatase family protein [Candidatus Angelobacter sp.]